jgi:pimeloyl-ACP methyl ester carboxylesterase
MQIVERGAGKPLVLVPGLQGRWEYMRATVDALARSHRVLTYSLTEEPEHAGDVSANAMNVLADQVVRVLDECLLSRAAVCGVSFGGLVALRATARHADRVSALILASTPGPRWHLRSRHDLYARWPRLFGPVFFAESPLRLRREVAIALPNRHARCRFAARQLLTLVSAPVSVSRMATRARMIAAYDRFADCARVSCPTLVVHGDPALDHVVDAVETSEYARLIRGARLFVLEGTGHLGAMTKPDAFAAAVQRFLCDASVDGSHDSAA